MNFQMVKLDLEKAEEPEIKLPTFVGSSKKQENSRKTSISDLLPMPKPLTVVPLYCGVSSLWVGLDEWLVKVSWLGKLASVLWGGGAGYLLSGVQ